jgi:hypothetical protein
VKKQVFLAETFSFLQFFRRFHRRRHFFDPATPALLSATSVRGEYISL